MSLRIFSRLSVNDFLWHCICFKVHLLLWISSIYTAPEREKSLRIIINSSCLKNKTQRGGAPSIEAFQILSQRRVCLNSSGCFYPSFIHNFCASASGAGLFINSSAERLTSQSNYTLSLFVLSAPWSLLMFLPDHRSAGESFICSKITGSRSGSCGANINSTSYLEELWDLCWTLTMGVYCWHKRCLLEGTKERELVGWNGKIWRGNGRCVLSNRAAESLREWQRERV